MSASATQWNPPPQQMPLTAVITGFHTCWCQLVKWRSNSADRLPVPLHAHTVTGDLGDVDAGLERPAGPGVHDDPHLRIGVQLPPRDRELVAHPRVHRVQLIGPVVDQPADRTASFHDEMIEGAR